jgi:hypothetical protein
MMKTEPVQVAKSTMFHNYKGQYAGNETEINYFCPITGAHFEF